MISINGIPGDRLRILEPINANSLKLFFDFIHQIDNISCNYNNKKLRNIRQLCDQIANSKAKAPSACLVTLNYLSKSTVYLSQIL